MFTYDYLVIACLILLAGDSSSIFTPLSALPASSFSSRSVVITKPPREGVLPVCTSKVK